MLNKFLLVLSVVAALVFIRKRLLRYLRYLQQDEYSSQRFLVWYRERRAFDKRGTLIGMLVGLALCWSTQQWLVLSVVLVGILALVIAAQREEDPRKAGKVRLVMTERARRIYQVAFGLLLALELATLYVLWQRELALVWLTFVVLVQLVPFGLLAAVRLLAPGERMRQVAFITEAEETLSSVATTVIGVTGSYGKTSVKNMLGEVLSTSLAATFWPKAGINTLMGNVRAVRNGLHAGYRYAVIEMGAYRTGSIAEQCALVRPTVGIITAIGEMHLERFGSVDNIYRAKTELADALPQTGILICNGDNAGARKAASEFERETTLLYGFDNTHEDLDCWVKSISFDESGSRFTLNWRGADYELQSKLLGRPAIHNLAGVFAAACVLGADPLLSLIHI